MIDLYTAATPNGYRISVVLKELGQPCRMQLLSFVQRWVDSRTQVQTAQSMLTR
ncbi:hypothetical protein D7241_07770 [Stutzerimonas sp. VN223-3]